MPKQPEIRHEVHGDRRYTIYDHTTAAIAAQRPETIECDFCTRRSDRLWLYHVRAFGVTVIDGPKPMRYVFDGGDWRACVFCRQMVDRRDLKLLLARVITLDPALEPAGIPRLYDALFSAMSDAAPREWHAGESIVLRVGV